MQVNAFGQWEEIHLPDTTFWQQRGVHDLVESNGKLIALAGPMFSSSDEGESWNRLPFEKEPRSLYSSDQILFLDTYDGQFFRSTDDGETWTNIDTSFLIYKVLPDPNDVYQVANINSLAFNAAEIFIGTDAGIFRSNDDGLNWTPSSKGLPKDYYNLHTSRITSLLFNDLKIYAGTDGNGIYISTDNGNNWDPINDGLPEYYDYTYIPTIGDLVYNGIAVFAICGNSIYRLNGSNVWEKIQNAIPDNGVFSIAHNDSILFALTLDALYSSGDNGNNWDEIYSGSLFNSGSFVDIKVFEPRFYLFGVYAGLNNSSDNGTTWNSINEGIGELRKLYPYQIDVYDSLLGVITNEGKIIISRDAGGNWEEAAFSVTSINNYIHHNKTFFNLFNYFYIKKEGVWLQIPTTGSFVDIVLADTTLIGISRTINWAGIYQGGINNGNIQDTNFDPTWNISLTGSTYYHSLRVNSNKIYVAASDGIYLSSDYGITWDQIGLKDKQIISLVLSDTNFIAQTADGFYKSFDGGYNWSSLYIGMDNIVNLDLCGDNLTALTRAPDYSYYKLWKRSFNEIITTLKEEQLVAEKFSLSQNYPNPFNPSTTISFSLPKSENVELKVFDLLGREVAVLLNEYKPAGEHKVEFNAGELSSGIYFYQFKAGDFGQTKKLVLLR